MNAWQPEALVEDMLLYKRSEAYSGRLTLAAKLTGRAKLAVLRNIYRRLIRWQDDVAADLKSRLREIETAELDYADDPEMKGRIALVRDQLTKSLSAWEDVAATQNEANLKRLEAVLSPKK